MVRRGLDEYGCRMRRGLLCVVLLVAACAPGEPPGARPSAAPPTEKVQRESHLVAGHDRPEHPCLEDAGPGPLPELVMGDTFFEPTCIVLRGRHDLRLTNAGSLSHSFGIRAAGVELDLEPGAVEQISLKALRHLGETEFFCRFHASAGMTGTITVL